MKRLVCISKGEAISEADRTALEALLSSEFTIDFVTNATEFATLQGSLDSNEQVFLIDHQLCADTNALQAITQQNNTQSSGTCVFPITFADTEARYEYIAPDSLVRSFTQSGNHPLLLVQTTGAIAASLGEYESLSIRELIARAIITSVAECIETTVASNPIVLSTDSAIDHCGLSNKEYARLLSFIIGSVNIEELFPNHAWTEHEEESAAACFHTLAAFFIKYGDIEAAEECLSFSDRLEDSPRSLALRALISKHNGETLGAVANLVSSLQQYETRKRNKDSEPHYLSFLPKDLEVINENLSQGLSALNKQENDKAFSHFATAVVNFDTFYDDLGVIGKE